MTEKKLVRPAYEKLSVVPPRFQTVTQTISTSTPRRVWKLGNPGALAAQGYRVLSTADAGQGGRGYRSTVQYGAARQAGATYCGAGCEIWCLVEEPGESISFDRKVMTSPGTVRRTSIPAKYTSVTKQIVSDPGGVREIPVPAQYRNIAVEYLADPGGERLVNVPAKYGSVQKKTLTAGQRYEWRRVVCDPAKGQASSYNRGRSASGAYIAQAYSGGGSTHYSSGAVGSSRGGSGSGYSAYSTGSGYTGSTGYRAYGSSSAYGHGTPSTYSTSTYGGTTTQTHSSQSQSTQRQVPVTTGVYYYGTDKPVQ
ncbi:MAG: hypothetical protein JKX72_07100 [Robiginitomaculum sp.]|nr:hypothetical protein [Robiginitomaculum sp.]